MAQSLNAEKFRRLLRGMWHHTNEMPIELKEVTSNELEQLKTVCEQELERRKGE